MNKSEELNKADLRFVVANRYAGTMNHQMGFQN